MPKQDKIVITDASCFITLDKIDGMRLLHSLYKQVITTPEIAAEFGKRLPDWVDVKAVLNRDLSYNYAFRQNGIKALQKARKSYDSGPFAFLKTTNYG